MSLSLDDVIAVSGIEPATGVHLRQRQLVGQPDFLKCAVTQYLMIAHPATVNIQANPDTSEGCKCPSRFLDFTPRLQIETVKGQFFCTKQSPHF